MESNKEIEETAIVNIFCYSHNVSKSLLLHGTAIDKHHILDHTCKSNRCGSQI